MGNTILTPTIISKEAAFQLENTCVLGANVYRPLEGEFDKIGASLTFRKPVKFESFDSVDITGNIQDVTEMSDTIVINKHKVVPFSFSEEDLTLSIEDYSERYIRPAVIKIADDIDRSIAELYKACNFTSGTAGTVPATFSALSGLGQKMDDLAMPEEGRMLVLNPAANWSLADALKGTFEPKGAKDFLRRGYLGNIANFDIMKTQSIYSHTAGGGLATGTTNTSGTVYVNSSDGLTATITVDAATAAAVSVGDVFTIANMYAVNPISKQTTSHLMQFTVTTAVATASTTNQDIVVSPAIYTSGPYQNVDAAPANSAAITLVGSHSANLAFTKNAFALAMAPIRAFTGSKSLEMHNVTHNGFALTVTMFADGITLKQVCRIDARWGVKVLYNDLACRLLG